jgi:hypothetical protein
MSVRRCPIIIFQNNELHCNVFQIGFFIWNLWSAKLKLMKCKSPDIVSLKTYKYIVYATWHPRNTYLVPNFSWAKFWRWTSFYIIYTVISYIFGWSKLWNCWLNVIVKMVYNTKFFKVANALKNQDNFIWPGALTWNGFATSAFAIFCYF